MNKPLTRAAVAPETTWDLADLFATRGAWLAELAAVERSVDSVAKHQGKLATGFSVLLACLDARDELLARLDRVGTFAALRAAEDGGNSGHQADQSSAAALGARMQAAIAFVDTEILALPEGAGTERVPAPLDRPRRQRRQGVGCVLRHALRRALRQTVGWVQQWSALGQFAGPPLVAAVARATGGWQWTWVATGACSLGGLLPTAGLSRLSAQRWRR